MDGLARELSFHNGSRVEDKEVTTSVSRHSQTTHSPSVYHIHTCIHLGGWVVVVTVSERLNGVHVYPCVVRVCVSMWV